MSYDKTKSDVKQLVEKIELLAKELQVELDNGNDCMMLANELVRHNSTFTFVLGELYGLQQVGSLKKSKVKVVKTPNPNAKPKSYKRDSLGRFSSV